MKISNVDEVHGLLCALCSEALVRALPEGDLGKILEDNMLEAAKEIAAQAVLSIEEKNAWKEAVERNAYLAEMARSAMAEEHLEELRAAVLRVMVADTLLRRNEPVFEHEPYCSGVRKNQDEQKAAWLALGALVRK